jgi:hypothetical protein
MSANWSFRLAVPEDVPSFAAWAATNNQIDQKDLLAGTGTVNPTVLTFAVEKDGKVVAFAPVFLSAVLSHLGFDPEADGKDKLRALNMLKDGVAGFFVQYGIRQIETMSKPEYAIAQWALSHGFEADSRTLLKLDLNREMGNKQEVPLV